MLHRIQHKPGPGGERQRQHERLGDLRGRGQQRLLGGPLRQLLLLLPRSPWSRGRQPAAHRQALPRGLLRRQPHRLCARRGGPSSRHGPYSRQFGSRLHRQSGPARLAASAGLSPGAAGAPDAPCEARELQALEPHLAVDPGTPRGAHPQQRRGPDLGGSPPRVWLVPVRGAARGCEGHVGVPTRRLRTLSGSGHAAPAGAGRLRAMGPLLLLRAHRLHDRGLRRHQRHHHGRDHLRLLHHGGGHRGSLYHHQRGDLHCHQG
mmetsp:Transcript_42637/g.110197  ORF Transcript_42637/g.110197 Transcript_42637/m.110197 type:complete len:262 (-) Transcript_42637:1522-2307(-)